MSLKALGLPRYGKYVSLKCVYVYLHFEYIYDFSETTVKNYQLKSTSKRIY